MTFLRLTHHEGRRLRIVADAVVSWGDSNYPDRTTIVWLEGNQRVREDIQESIDEIDRQMSVMGFLPTFQDGDKPSAE